MKINPYSFFQILSIANITLIGFSTYFLGIATCVEKDFNDAQMLFIRSFIVVVCGSFFAISNALIKQAIESQIESEVQAKSREFTEMFGSFVTKLQSVTQKLDVDARNEVEIQVNSFIQIIENQKREKLVALYFSNWLGKNRNRDELVRFIANKSKKNHPSFFTKKTKNFEEFKDNLDICLKWIKISLERNMFPQKILLDKLGSLLVEDPSCINIYKTSLNSIPTYPNYEASFLGIKRQFFNLKRNPVTQSDIHESEILKYLIRELIQGLETESTLTP